MEKARSSRLSSILYPFFCAKLFSARSVSAMITTATDRLIVMASFIGITVRSGKCHTGSPGFTLLNVCTPHASSGRNFVISAPAAIRMTANGIFGHNFLVSKRMARDISPSTSDTRLISGSVCTMCSASSGNSPVPAVPPSSFGSCIRIMVVQIPVIKPPITGAEIKFTSLPAFIR